MNFLQADWSETSGASIYRCGPGCELFSHARRAPAQISTLFVSGYSFGDKAVNMMLVEWIESAQTGKHY